MDPEHYYRERDLLVKAQNRANNLSLQAPTKAVARLWTDRRNKIEQQITDLDTRFEACHRKDL